MITRKIFAGIAVASLVMLAMGMSPAPRQAAQALASPQQPDDKLTISYTGQLSDEAGRIVTDGAYDFTFTLYNAESGGELLWSETHTGVDIKGGEFSVALGSQSALPEGALKGEGLWLEVSVRGPGEADFAALAPRQALASVIASPAAPSDGPACPHDHLLESWTGTSSFYSFWVENLGSGDSIRAYAHNSSGMDWGAFFGYNYGSGSGVVGRSADGVGVFGDGDEFGVYGEGDGGVKGVGFTNDGVVGTTSASGKSGVYGVHTGTTGNGGFFSGPTGAHGTSTTGFGLSAAGAGDTSSVDLLGDLNLVGDRGEIYALDGWLNLYGERDIIMSLDMDNDDTNACYNIRSWNGSSYDYLSSVCENGTKSAILETEDFGQRKVYTIESPEVWLEDIGSAALVDGEAFVTFDPIFAQTANLEIEYHVFVTPVCQEPVLLYVTAKTPGGFSVSGVTLSGAPSSCGFDYRVSAKRLGLEDLRLETFVSEDMPAVP